MADELFGASLQSKKFVIVDVSPNGVFDKKDIIFDRIGHVVYSPNNRDCFEEIKEALEVVLQSGEGTATCGAATYVFKNYKIQNPPAITQEIQVYKSAPIDVGGEDEDKMWWLYKTVKMASAASKNNLKDDATVLFDKTRKLAIKMSRPDALSSIALTEAALGLKTEATADFLRALDIVKKVKRTTLPILHLLKSIGADLVEAKLNSQDSERVLERMGSIAKAKYRFKNRPFMQVHTLVACAESAKKLGSQKYTTEFYDAAIKTNGEAHKNDAKAYFKFCLVTILPSLFEAGFGNKTVQLLDSLFNDKIMLFFAADGETVKDSEILTSVVESASGNLPILKLGDAVVPYYKKLIGTALRLGTEGLISRALEEIAHGVHRSDLTDASARILFDELTAAAQKIGNPTLRKDTKDQIKATRKARFPSSRG